MTIWLDPLAASLALALNLAPALDPALDPARLAAAKPGLVAVVAGLMHPVFKAKPREVSNWRFEAAAAVEGQAPLAARLMGGRGSLPRCVKLNNYWCIKKAGWAGEIAADGEGHVAFATAREGAIVAAKLLRRYYMDFGRHDAMAIVSHWAPAQCGLLTVHAPRAMRFAARSPVTAEKSAKAAAETDAAPKRYNPDLMRPIPRPMLKALKPIDEASAAQAAASSSKPVQSEPHQSEPHQSKPVESGSAKSKPVEATRAAAPGHHHLASLEPALHALAAHSLGTTLRARWLATHRPGGMPRRSATTRLAQVHHHAAHRSRVAATPVRAAAKPAEKVAAIMAGEPDISLAPVRLASLGSFELLPAAPLMSCSGDTQRIHNYAERAIAGIVQGTHDDLKLFAEDGTPGPNLLPMMLNMAKVEIGPLGARPSLIAAAIAAAFPGKHPAGPAAEAPADRPVAP